LTPANPLVGAAGGGGNPIASVIAALAGKGGAAPPGGGAGEQLAKQTADLQGADPGQLMKQAEQVNKVMGVMFVQNFQRLPNVANQISKAMSQWSRVIKELQQAAGVQSAISKPEIQQSLVTPSGGPGADTLGGGQ
jgi:hypothetical protein